MRYRSDSGSFIAENTAVVVVILLVLTFPLINLATSTYRYNMVCGAAKAAAHAAASAPTFTNPTTGVVAVVPAVVDNYLKDARGVTNVNTRFRINQAAIDPPQTVTNLSFATKLSGPADPDKFIYSIEVVVDADVAPLVTMALSGLIPNVPGLTGPTRQSSAAQEVVETIHGLDD